jgi:hypothetical protein
LWIFYQGSVLPKILPFRWCRQLGAQTIDASAHDLPLMPLRTPLPARYPPIGTWPALMRADMAAAYLDYRNTGELARAVVRGEAPPPTGYHGIGRAREPVWSKAVIDNFTAPARALDLDRSEGEDLSSLV